MSKFFVRTTGTNDISRWYEPDHVFLVEDVPDEKMYRVCKHRLSEESVKQIGLNSSEYFLLRDRYRNGGLGIAYDECTIVETEDRLLNQDFAYILKEKED